MEFSEMKQIPLTRVLVWKWQLREWSKRGDGNYIVDGDARYLNVRIGDTVELYWNDAVPAGLNGADVGESVAKLMDDGVFVVSGKHPSRRLPAKIIDYLEKGMTKVDTLMDLDEDIELTDEMINEAVAFVKAVCAKAD